MSLDESSSVLLFPDLDSCLVVVAGHRIVVLRELGQESTCAFVD